LILAYSVLCTRYLV